MSVHTPFAQACQRTLHAAITLLCLVGILSCGSVRTKVNTFKASDWSPSGGTIAVRAQREQLESSLEFAHYRKQLEAQLQAIGFELAAAQNADYVALLDYQVDQDADHSKSRPASVYVGAGAARYAGQGAVLITDSEGRPQYRRSVAVVIAQNDSDKTHLYEVKGLSYGSCAVLSNVFAPIVEAMFKDFPGQDGALETVAVAGSERC